MNVITRDKDAYHRQTSERMKRHFVLPEWSPRQKLALTCRILAAEGHDSGLAGQATIRGDAPGTYYMLRFGLGFDEIRPENILLRQNGDASGAVNSFPGRVLEGHFHGTQTIYAIETLGQRLEAIELGTVPRFAVQDQIRVVIPPEQSWVFPQ